jgi:hypothetical protein
MARAGIVLGVTASLVMTFAAAPASAEKQVWRGSPEGGVTSVRQMEGSPSANSVNTPITRSEVLSRAKSWADVPVSYSMYRYRNGYRTDCSGYVSMTWRLGSSRTTGTFGPVTHRITKNELKGGDVLRWDNTGPGVGHIVLFEKWADDSRSSYWAYEQTPDHTKHRIVPYPYFPGRGGPYVPLRYDKIVDDLWPNNDRDVNGDGRSDVLARNSAGALHYYRGRGNGSHVAPLQTYSKGWSEYDGLFAADVNGDRRADVLARTEKGALYYFRGKGNGTFNSRVRKYSTAFKQYTQVVAADVNGGGRADLLARDSKGALYYYRGKGTGSFYSRVRTYANGWNQYNLLLAGDVNRDGRADLLARDSKGALYYYRGGGKGTFYSRVRVFNSGWNQYDAVVATGVNRDGRLDLLARTKAGALYYYRGNGNGTFYPRALMYSKGWSQYDSLM